MRFQPSVACQQGNLQLFQGLVRLCLLQEALEKARVYDVSARYPPGNLASNVLREWRCIQTKRECFEKGPSVSDVCFAQEWNDVLQETIREGLRRRRDHDLLAAAEERYQERRATKASKWKNNRLLRKVTVLTLNYSSFVRIQIVNAFSLALAGIGRACMVRR